jgi:hypothetical protein
MFWGDISQNSTFQTQPHLSRRWFDSWITHQRNLKRFCGSISEMTLLKQRSSTVALLFSRLGSEVTGAYSTVSPRCWICRALSFETCFVLIGSRTDRCEMLSGFDVLSYFEIWVQRLAFSSNTTIMRTKTKDPRSENSIFWTPKLAVSPFGKTFVLWV